MAKYTITESIPDYSRQPVITRLKSYGSFVTRDDVCDVLLRLKHHHNFCVSEWAADEQRIVKQTMAPVWLREA